MKMKTLSILLALSVVTLKGAEIDEGDTSQETRCHPRCDGEYMLSHKVAKMEATQEALQTILDNQKKLIGDLEEKLRVSLLPYWGDWSSWSGCYMNCSGTDGGRMQSRSRETMRNSLERGSKRETETETRPCNAVQFVGCVKDFGANDNYGITYDFADQIAVSTCTALHPGGSDHVYAVRRTCSNLAVSCEETCKHVGLKCFNALHVYRGSHVLKRNQDSTKGLYMYRYNNCGGSYCGPNFCCCRN